MPILSAETEQYPDDLFDADFQPGDRSWWVLHTRPRQEKSVARQLHNTKTPFYLPLARRPVRVRNRTVISYVPLFSSYVFVLANSEERLGALATNRVVQAIRVTDQDQLVRDLLQVARLIRSGAALTVEDELVPGSVVEVQSGPFMGMKGKIVQKASGFRFVVEVDFIRRGISVLLEGQTLRAITGEN